MKKPQEIRENPCICEVMKLNKEFRFFTFLIESYAQEKNKTTSEIMKILDEKNLTDEMYEKAAMHNEDGAWQMIFGVKMLMCDKVTQLK